MTFETVKPALFFTVCAALASSVGLELASCGGSSGGARPGSGGSIGSTGGAGVGTGGASGGAGGGAGGGASGMGGSAACAIPYVPTTQLSCAPGVSPADPLLTDFMPGTWNNTMGKWGCGTLTGSAFSYGGAKATSKVMSAVDLATHALVLSGNVESGDYGGGGLAFDQCVNTTQYGGVQFTLGGSSGGCDVVLQVQTFMEKPVTAMPKGGCTPAAGGGGCYSFPQAKLPATSGVLTVMFWELAGGMPVGADAIKQQLVGLQWQLQSPPPPPLDAGLQPSCGNISLSITDVKFVP